MNFSKKDKKIFLSIFFITFTTFLTLFVSNFVLFQFILVLLTFWLLKVFGLSLEDIKLKKEFLFRSIILSIAGLFIFQVINLINFKTPEIDKGLLLPVIIANLLVAVKEEVWFRGILFKYFKERFKAKWVAIIITSLLFGFMHIIRHPPISIVKTSIFGFIQALVLVYGKNLTGPIVSHFAFNMMMYFIV